MASGSMRAKINKLARQTANRAKTAPKLSTVKRGQRLDPKERSWAHAYLRYVAKLKGYPYTGARESMQDVATYFGIEIPIQKNRAGRSRVAIDLANDICDRTGIRMPDQQQGRRRDQSNEIVSSGRAADQPVPS